jgi:hypothetical protein
MNFLRVHRPDRKLSALMVLCYLWLSIILPTQHTDHFVRQIEPLRNSASGQQFARNSHVIRHSADSNIHRQERCIACEWQAAQVSVALSAFALVLTKSEPPQAVTTFPCSLCLITFPASSRAPPLV